MDEKLLKLREIIHNQEKEIEELKAESKSKVIAEIHIDADEVIKRIKRNYDIERRGADIQSKKVSPINYEYCSNAMSRMLVDEIVTYEEYNKIMNKLAEFWSEGGN